MPTPASIATGLRAPESVADCDAALRLLRVMRRNGGVEERELAQLSIDRVLDLRNKLARKRRVRG